MWKLPEGNSRKRCFFNYEIFGIRVCHLICQINETQSYAKDNNLLEASCHQNWTLAGWPVLPMRNGSWPWSVGLNGTSGVSNGTFQRLARDLLGTTMDESITMTTWLVVDLALWKMMEWKSLGMMKFPAEWKIIHSCSKPPTSYCFLITQLLCSSHDELWNLPIE